MRLYKKSKSSKDLYSIPDSGGCDELDGEASNFSISVLPAGKKKKKNSLLIASHNVSQYYSCTIIVVSFASCEIESLAIPSSSLVSTTININMIVNSL